MFCIPALLNNEGKDEKKSLKSSSASIPFFPPTHNPSMYIIKFSQRNTIRNLSYQCNALGQPVKFNCGTNTKPSWIDVPHTPRLNKS